MKKLTYKEAIIKQTSIIVVAFVIILGNIWILKPINTPLKFITIVALVLIIGFYLFQYIRKNAYKQSCIKCHADIFPFIEFGKSTKQEVKFCPICGEKIEI